MAPDLVCLSHLRWTFVYQRPNHLMARAARDRRVYFIEEPRVEPAAASHLLQDVHDNVTVVTPVVPYGLDAAQQAGVLAQLIDGLIVDEAITDPTLWYYTPMALPWTRQVAASLVVYDSMDYLPGFRGAPTELSSLEDELMARADLVFTGGLSLHGRMAGRHASVHCFPSSVDVAHFRRPRTTFLEPSDLSPIDWPRVVYAGVLDERIDFALIAGVADAQPDVSFVLIGPLAKIEERHVPRRPNIHRLGLKPYEGLPAYLAWSDIGWMPFARNEATRYISPTKTLEYLAAGLPVVSTSIRDVVDPYGAAGLARIADSVAETVSAIDDALLGRRPSASLVDRFLEQTSWDRTWATMAALIADRGVGRPRAGGAHTPAQEISDDSDGGAEGRRVAGRGAGETQPVPAGAND